MTATVRLDEKLEFKLNNFANTPDFRDKTHKSIS